MCHLMVGPEICCVCVRVSAGMHTYVPMCMWIYVCGSVCVCKDAHICASMCVGTRSWLCVCVQGSAHLNVLMRIMLAPGTTCAIFSAGSQVIDFDGKSSLLYRFVKNTSSSAKDVISLKFKTMLSDGVLLHREGRGGDSVTLALVKGTLFLLVGSGKSTRQGAPPSDRLVINDMEVFLHPVL